MTNTLYFVMLNFFQHPDVFLRFILESDHKVPADFHKNDRGGLFQQTMASCYGEIVCVFQVESTYI
jgi:hypothetical protein